LQAWVRHLDDLGVDHSGVINGGAGHLMVLADPDDIYIPDRRGACLRRRRHRDARRRSRAR
jgi:hypothetical protein